jgi:hypothetical protein
MTVENIIDWELWGIPLHPLLVHATVVLIPLAALMLGVSAVWPAAARKLTFLTPLVAAVACGFALVTHTSGEWLEERVRETAAVERHASDAGVMNAVAIALLLVAVLLWAWQTIVRRRIRDRAMLVRAVDIVLGIIAVLMAIGAIVAVVIVGHSGAAATWG